MSEIEDNSLNPTSDLEKAGGEKCPRCGHKQELSEFCDSCGLVQEYYYLKVKQYEPAPIAVIFQDAWELYINRFKTLMAISMIFYLLYVLLHSGLYVSNESVNSDEVEFIESLLISLVVFIISAWTLGAYVSVIVDESLSIKNAMLAGVKLWPHYLLMSFIAALLIMLGTFALIIPGIILALRYSFRDYILFCENKRGYHAIEHSAKLVEGRWFKVFSRILPIWILSFSPNFLPLNISILALVLITPFCHVYLYTLYRSLSGSLEIKRDENMSEIGNI